MWLSTKHTSGRDSPIGDYIMSSSKNPTSFSSGSVKYVKKTITITEEQAKWIEDTSINLSRFVQKKIDKEIK